MMVAAAPEHRHAPADPPMPRFLRSSIGNSVQLPVEEPKVKEARRSHRRGGRRRRNEQRRKARQKRRTGSGQDQNDDSEGSSSSDYSSGDEDAGEHDQTSDK